MSGNGKLTGQRARIEMLAAADPREAAAVIAAVEQFLVDTAPTHQPTRTADPWQRAALVEGVSSKLAFGPTSPDGRESWQ